MQKIKAFFIRFLVVLLALQGVVAAELINIKRAAAAGGSVVINEVMWMGTYSDGTNHIADEWIELRNMSGSAVDISGWILTNAGSAGDLSIASGTIPANGYFLIANNDDTSPSSILNVAPDLVITTIALNNSCESIDLIRADATTADSMGCDGGDYFAGLNNTADKRAMERNFIVADGTLATSWHTSTLFANLDAGALGNNLASPKSANSTDVTPPDIGQVTDDGLFTASTTQLHANWSGFSDPESGIASYLAGVGTSAGLNDVVALTDVGLDTSHTFSGLTLAEDVTYYINVVATNGVGLISLMASSDGITVNTVNPNPPTNVTALDPTDGTINVTWDASTSMDGISYDVEYGKLGETPATKNTASLSTILSGLDVNVDYYISVKAVDFNSQISTQINADPYPARAHLPLVLTNVVVGQNKPGDVDTVRGTAGSSSEPNGVTATVLSASPGDPTAIILGSVAVNPVDGSWPAVGIGDNKYGQVWIQLSDGTHLSNVLSPLNDIVGPTAPVLSKAVANCESDNCRVTLDWQAGSADTASYKVTYTVDGVDHQTFEVTTTSMALDLRSGKTYQFKVVGYDQYGNPSTPSNVFSIALTKGVKTTVTASGTVTEAISGTLEVSTTPSPKSAPAQFAPKAKAAEPVTETPLAADKPLVADAASSHDWIRIFVVVILLLIIAGSFYALSRSVQETPEEAFDKAASKSKAPLTPTTGRRHRRRSRRKRT